MLQRQMFLVQAASCVMGGGALAADRQRGGCSPRRLRGVAGVAPGRCELALFFIVGGARSPGVQCCSRRRIGGWGGSRGGVGGRAEIGGRGASLMRRGVSGEESGVGTEGGR